MKKLRAAGKAASIIMAVTLCVTAFTGCGKKIDTDEVFEQAQKIDKNCIYKAKEYEGILGENEQIGAIGHSGDKIMAICKSGDGGYKYISFNSNGSDVQSNDLGWKEGSNVSTGAFDKDGNAYVTYSESSDDSSYSTLYFVKIDPTGKELSRVNIDEEFPVQGGSYFMHSMTWSDKYGLLCGTSQGVMTYDEQNGFQTFMDCKALGISEAAHSVVSLADNKLFVYSYPEKYEIVDLASKKVEKKCAGFGKQTIYTGFADDSGNLYVENDSGIFKYDQDADALNKILDFGDSSVSSDEIDFWAGIVGLNEKEIIATINGDESDCFLKLTKVNPEDVVDKTIITLSALSMDRGVKDQIMKFNRSSDKYVIKIIDYYDLCDGDYEQMIKQYNLDLTSGKMADILCLSGNEASIKKYVDKGMLMDLTSAFEKGGPLGDMELLPNIAEMMKYNGKTYTFIPSFTISTDVVKASDANGKKSLTYQDWDDIIKSKGVDYKTAIGGYTGKTELCSYMWMYYGDEFIDLKNKKCNFNSPEFIEYLNFANKFPEAEEVDYVIESDIDRLYAEGKGIFYGETFRNIWEYAKLKQVVFKDDIEFVGCPNNSGKNPGIILGTALAVNSKTEHKDVIFNLIADMMNPEGKTENGFSSVKSKFEEELQEATKEQSDNNSDATAYDPFKEDYVKLQPLTQEDIQKFYDFAVSVDTCASFDPQISNIIIEEASAFFAGQKTAEEVAEIIQKRVSIYVNENS